MVDAAVCGNQYANRACLLFVVEPVTRPFGLCPLRLAGTLLPPGSHSHPLITIIIIVIIAIAIARHQFKRHLTNQHPLARHPHNTSLHYNLDTNPPARRHLAGLALPATPLIV